MNQVKLFIIYSRKDGSLKNEMIAHLQPLVRGGDVEIWDDQEIKPGEQWDASIKEKIQESEIVIALISSDFFSSDYIQNVEMQEALIRHSNNECVVIPVILRPCNWNSDPSLKNIQVLPSDAKPVISSRWDNTDEAWENVIFGIKKTISVIKFNSQRKDEIESLKEKVKTLESRNADLQIEVNRNKDQINNYVRLSSQLEECSRNLNQIEKKLKTSYQDIEKLKIENKNIKGKVKLCEELLRKYITPLGWLSIISIAPAIPVWLIFIVVLLLYKELSKKEGENAAIISLIITFAITGILFFLISVYKSDWVICALFCIIAATISAAVWFYFTSHKDNVEKVKEVLSGIEK